ncbi:MAG: hypothetical protein P4N60_20965 [Verrucomicrobiae bacterium]|nr:hypothetical protein [Verrucomicrobiae bacterium]
MRFPNTVFVGAASLPLLMGCNSTPVVLPPVGPEPAGHAAKSLKGYLQVFSATEKSPPVASDDTTFFNLHSGYDIHDESGRTVRFVPNHASNMDEWPDQVALPAGTYSIVAESACCGQVSVPVVIQAGQTTVVHLDRNWFPPANVPAGRLIHLPDGEAVGWSGATAASSE